MDVSLATGYFEIEHIIPKSVHPEWMYEPIKLCVACSICNSSKKSKNVLNLDDYSKLPLSSSDYVIIHPHFDKYFDNIQIVDNLLYVGLTKKGINTIEICNLMRPELLLERAKNFIKSEQYDGAYSKLLIMYYQNLQFIGDFDGLLKKIEELVELLG